MADAFSIEILEKRWLSGMPEELDLCAHGIVRVHAGEWMREDEVSLSAAGLHLLRSAVRGHEPDAMAKLFPVDGFCWTPGPAGEIYLGGCPNGGMDGRVTCEGGHAVIKLESAPAIRIPWEEYRETVCLFAGEVRDFYQASKAKRPEDTCVMDQLWYPQFWQEWHARWQELHA